MGIRLDGMTELKAQLERLGARAVGVQEEALKAGAEIVRDEAKDRLRTHRKTGTLEDSVIISDVEDGKIEIGPNKDGFYGYFVEFGTSKMSAIPFLQPAFEQNVNRITQSMANVIRRELGL